MNRRMISIIEEAERLPAADRVKLVEHLMATLDKPDHEVDQAWAEESEQRFDRYLQGGTPALDAEDVISRHLKR